MSDSPEDVHRAVETESVNLKKSLLWTGENVNEPDIRGRTALHIALSSPRRDTQKIQSLLSRGADVNAQDIYGRTPLHYACRLTDQDSVVTLLRSGAKLGSVDCLGATPLHDLADNFYIGSNVLSLLVYTRDVDADMWSSLVCHREGGEVLSVLDLQDAFGETALHRASVNNNHRLVNSLLLLGARAGIKNIGGKTALHRACDSLAKNAVGVLLDSGGHVNGEDDNGSTPLHLACSAGRNLFNSTLKESFVKTVDLLLRGGADVNERDANMKTPYELLTGCELRPRDRVAIEEAFIKHVVRLTTVKQLDGFHFEWMLGSDFHNETKDQCLREFEGMKCTKIVKDISLYDVLAHANKPYHTSTEELLQIDYFLSSTVVFTRFPLYGETLRTSFLRRKLLTLAVHSLYAVRRNRMVRELPCEMVEHLLTYVTNEGLRNLIQSGYS